MGGGVNKGDEGRLRGLRDIDQWGVSSESMCIPQEGG